MATAGYSGAKAPEAGSCPEPLRGFVWKKSPTSVRVVKGAWDWRFFEVRKMHLFWWASEKDASPGSGGSDADGGPKCKGIIDLLANDCVVEAVEGSPTQFALSAKTGSWSKEAREKGKKMSLSRVFTFDAKGSEHDRKRWMDSISQHLEHVTVVKSFCAPPSDEPKVDDAPVAPSEPAESSEKPVAHAEWNPKVGDIVYYRAQCNILPDGTELVYGTAGSIEIVGGDEDAAINVKFEGIEYIIGFSKVEICQEFPPVMLASGFEMFSTVFHKGGTHELPDGTEIVYGTAGKVVGPGTPGDGDDQGVAVRYSGNQQNVLCNKNDLSSEKPPMDLAKGFKVGAEITYLGPKQDYPGTFEEGGGQLKYNDEGKVVGPDSNEQMIVIKVPALKKCVCVFMADIKIK